MEIEKIWDEWKTEKLIGEGAYGKVYKCSKNTIENGTEYCAVKVIPIPRSMFEADSLLLDGMTLEQSNEYYYEIVDEYVSEISLLQKLKSCPNIVHMYDYKVVKREKSVGWDIYIRMELLTTFSEYISDKTIDDSLTVKFGIDILNALVECEKHNIIHRDIKPENIFIDENENFKLGDFGTAKEFEKTLATYSLRGTYNYMSPEVFNGKKYDVRSDIYSLGLVMYRMLNNNRVPFVDPDKQLVRHQDRMDALSKRLKGDAMPKPKNASETLSAVILKVCEFKPENRFENAKQMKTALEELNKNIEKPKAMSIVSGIMNTAKKHKLLSSIVSIVLILAILSGSVAYTLSKKKNASDNESAALAANNASQTKVDESINAAPEILSDNWIVNSNGLITIKDYGRLWQFNENTLKTEVISEGDFGSFIVSDDLIYYDSLGRIDSYSIDDKKSKLIIMTDGIDNSFYSVHDIVKTSSYIPLSKYDESEKDSNWAEFEEDNTTEVWYVNKLLFSTDEYVYFQMYDSDDENCIVKYNIYKGEIEKIAVSKYETFYNNGFIFFYIDINDSNYNELLCAYSLETGKIYKIGNGFTEDLIFNGKTVYYTQGFGNYFSVMSWNYGEKTTKTVLNKYPLIVNGASYNLIMYSSNCLYFKSFNNDGNNSYSYINIGNQDIKQISFPNENSISKKGMFKKDGKSFIYTYSSETITIYELSSNGALSKLKTVNGVKSIGDNVCMSDKYLYCSTEDSSGTVYYKL